MDHLVNINADNIIGDIKTPNFAVWLKYQSECLESIDKAIADGKREMLVHAATGFGKTTLYRRIIKASKGPCWINLPSVGSKEILSKDLDIQYPKHLIDLDSLSEKKLNTILNSINKDSVILCTYPLLNMIHKNSPQLFDEIMKKLGSFEHPAQIHSDEAHRGIGIQTIEALKQMTNFENTEEGSALTDLDGSDEAEIAVQEFDEDEREYDDTISDIISKNKNIYNICRTATPTYSHKSVKNHFPTVFTFTKQQAIEIGVSVPVKNIPLGEGVQYVSKKNYTEKDLINGTDKYFISKKIIDENGKEKEELFRADELIPQVVADIHKENPIKAMGVGANIDHLYELQEKYNALGIKIYIVHSGNRKHKASGSLMQAKQLMESGKIDMMLVCNTGIELLDIPTLNLGVVHYSPHSPVKLNQFIGRIDRSNEGKEFTKLICPPTKIIYEPKETVDKKETSKDKQTYVSTTVGKLRREDAYYTLGDFTIEYLEANGLTYLQIYIDYLNSQKSKRELIEATRNVIWKSFTTPRFGKNIATAKEVYDICDLGDPDNIDIWLNECKDLVVMNKIRMYEDTARMIRLGGKSVRFTKSAKFDEKDISHEITNYIGDHRILDEYKRDNLTKANMSEYIYNIENLRNQYEEEKGILTDRPLAQGANGGIGITNRNITNRDQYRGFLNNPKVKNYSQKLLEIAMPYVVYIVKSFEDNVINNSESSALQSDDYISMCLEYFWNNIALYQNIDRVSITQWICYTTMDILLDSVVKNGKYGIDTGKLIRDINYIKNKDQEYDGDGILSNRTYKNTKLHIDEYTSGKLNTNELEHSFGFDGLYDEDLKLEINRSLNSLAHREKEFLEIYFGLNGYWDKDQALQELYKNIITKSTNKSGEISDDKIRKYTIDYISSISNLTSTRVAYIIEKAIRRLRQTARSRRLSEYVGGKNEENYIKPYHIPHKRDNNNSLIIPEVLKGGVYENEEIFAENSLKEHMEEVTVKSSIMREKLINTINLNFSTSGITDVTKRYACLNLYDYMIGYTGVHNISRDTMKYIGKQLETKGFKEIIKESNAIRNSKGLKPFDIYDLFNHYNWFDLLKYQNFVKLNSSEYIEIQNYIYCENYPKHEFLKASTKEKLDALMKLDIIGRKLQQTRAGYLRMKAVKNVTK